MENSDDHERMLVRVTASIVAAYVGQNGLSAPELPKLIGEVHKACRDVSSEEAPKEELTPAVPPHQSVKRGHLVCLEDGKTFKSLKRHLRAEHDMSPQEYRERWGLPSDYPMVAPEYSAKRSRLAKDMGLGGNVAAQNGRAAPAPQTAGKSAAKPAAKTAPKGSAKASAKSA